MSNNKLTLDKLVTYIQTITKPIEIQVDDSSSETDEQKIDLNTGEMSNLTTFMIPLKKILDPHLEEYYRYGVHKNNKENITFYYSLLFCLDSIFLNIPESEKVIYIKKVVNKINNDVKHQYKLYKSYGWKKEEILSDINNFTNSNISTLILSNYFNVNIIIFNQTNSSINAIYYEPEFNKYKSTVFMSLTDKYYEPIIDHQHRIFTHNDNMLKTLIENHKKSIIVPNAYKTQQNKLFSVGLEDLDKYIIQEVIQESKEEIKEEEIKEEVKEVKQDMENSYEEISEEHGDSPALEFSDKTEDIEDLDLHKGIFMQKKENNIDVVVPESKATLKMKLDELQQLSLKLGINVNKNINGKDKAKTKMELCNEIQNYKK